jgi:1-acyl-sn-glycerol-3-phosphate acyltransferase
MNFYFYKMIHPLLIALVKKQRIHKLHFVNNFPEVKGNIIVAANHSCKYDFPIICESLKKHVYVLVGKQRLNLTDRVAFLLNGVIYVDRKDKDNRKKAGKRMRKIINRGRSLCIFPEGTWNLTPSKPMLPLYWGIIDIAKETGRPILPLVLEYRNQECYVSFGQPIYIYGQDDKSEKIREIRDIMATMKWKIWEQFPTVARNGIPNDEWEREVKRRLEEYPLLDYAYEQSIVRSI